MYKKSKDTVSLGEAKDKYYKNYAYALAPKMGFVCLSRNKIYLRFYNTLFRYMIL